MVFGSGATDVAVDYNEDWLQRIVGVHWRDGGVTGALFVLGMVAGNEVGYVKFKNNADKSPKLQYAVLHDEPVSTSGSDQPTFSVKGVSFASIKNISVFKDNNRPVFILAGIRTVPVEVVSSGGIVFSDFNYFGLIYASRDGLLWNNVYEKDVIADTDYNQTLDVAAVVWEPKAQAFYYSQAYNSVSRLGPDVVNQEQIYGSTDGIAWGQISITNIDPNVSYKSVFPSSYCSHINCVDFFEQHVPDGVVWQDTKGKDVVRPVSPPIVFYGSIGGPGFAEFGNNTAEIIHAGIGTVSRRWRFQEFYTLNCIAGAGNVLLAGGWATADTNGSGAIVFSLNGGKTWQLLTETPVGVITMVGSSF